MICLLLIIISIMIILLLITHSRLLFLIISNLISFITITIIIIQPLRAFRRTCLKSMRPWKMFVEFSLCIGFASSELAKSRSIGFVGVPEASREPLEVPQIMIHRPCRWLGDSQVTICRACQCLEGSWNSPKSRFVSLVSLDKNLGVYN